MRAAPSMQSHLPAESSKLPELPTLPLEPTWREQPRGWPHAVHATCTYLGSLPATLAHDLVARWSRPGDVVLDPFSGRGSVPLQACLERRVGVGVDRNPLAFTLTGAAIDPPTPRQLEDRIARLRIDWSRERDDGRATTALDDPAAIGPAGGFFHPTTLAQLLLLRRELDRRHPVDRAILAALVGILHGSRSSALTDAMPNAFSMAPGYASRWVATRGTPPPERDVFRLLQRRLLRLRRDGLPASRGIAIEGDARRAGEMTVARLRATGAPDRVRLVVTSPPYLGLVRYGSANWLRLWLLGEDATAVDARLDTPRSLDASATLLSAVLLDIAPHLTDDAIVVLVLGTVRSHRGRATTMPLDLARSAWESAAAPAGYRLAGVFHDPVDPLRKLTRLWGARAGDATRSDTLLVVAPTELGRRRALAGARLPVDWSRSAGTTSGPPSRRWVVADEPGSKAHVTDGHRPGSSPFPRPDDASPNRS